MVTSPLDRKAALAAALVAVVAIAAFVGIYLVDLANAPSPQNHLSTTTTTETTTETTTVTVTIQPPSQEGIQVSGVDLEYDPGPTLHAVVRNLYNSSITTVGVQVNDSLFPPESYDLSPGQANDLYLPLAAFKLASLQSYNISMTFTLADGRYTTLATHCITPSFVDNATIVAASFVSPNLRLTMGNAGNVPVEAAVWYIEGQNPPVNGSLGAFSPLLNGQTVSIAQSVAAQGYSPGQFYSLFLNVSYADGSMNRLRTILVGGAASTAQMGSENLSITPVSPLGSFTVTNLGSGTSLLTVVNFDDQPTSGHT